LVDGNDDMITKLKITNSRGGEFEFGRLFRLTKGLDLSGLVAKVNFSTNSRAGSKYQNTKLENREFDIEFKMIRSDSDEVRMDSKRANMYRVFNPELNPMRVDLEMSDGKQYYLMANLQSTPVMPPDHSNNNGAWQKALLQFIATDPYIYEKDARKVDIAKWVGAFKFPLKIPQGVGIKMGKRSNSLIVNVFNEGQNKTGMLIRFKALATVVRPAIINVDTYEELRLNYTMTQGDVIEVTTYDGNMTITLIKDNVKTDIFNAIDLYSRFLQIEPGDNLFRYEADTGVDNLEMSLTYRAKSVGV